MCFKRLENISQQSLDLMSERVILAHRISRFAAIHNAVTDWQRNLCKGKASISELRDLLVREDGRPILIFGTSLKVFEQDETHFAWFDEAKHLESQVAFLLECTPEQAEFLRLNPRDFDAYARDNYALVARIESVEATSGRYSCYAKGKCVDFLPLSFDEFWGVAYPRGLSVF